MLFPSKRHELASRFNCEAYVLVDTGVIIAFLLAVFVIGRLRQPRREQRGEE
jgi:hypothetical protein